jgi:hypothetical protein
MESGFTRGALAVMGATAQTASMKSRTSGSGEERAENSSADDRERKKGCRPTHITECTTVNPRQLALSNSLFSPLPGGQPAAS